MLEKINNNQIPDILKELYSKQVESSKGPENNQADASLQVSCESLIEKATQSTQEDTDAVQQARQLLLSGQLDNPENIREAAENIVKFGI